MPQAPTDKNICQVSKYSHQTAPYLIKTGSQCRAASGKSFTGRQHGQRREKHMEVERGEQLSEGCRGWELWHNDLNRGGQKRRDMCGCH